MLRKNFPDRKKRRQEEAVIRQEAYDKLSTQEKLDKLEREGYMFYKSSRKGELTIPTYTKQAERLLENLRKERENHGKNK